MMVMDGGLVRTSLSIYLGGTGDFLWMDCFFTGRHIVLYFFLDPCLP